MRAILLALLSASPAVAEPCPAKGGVEVPLFEGAKVDFLVGNYRAFHDKATSVITGTEYETLFNPLIVGAPKGFKSCTTILQRIETGGMVQEIVLFDTRGTPVSLYLMGAEMSGRMHVLSFRYSTSIGDVLERLRSAAALAVLTVATPARACDLALALAVDVSGSVDGSEYRLQMDGLAAALRDPVIAEALVRGGSHLMLVQWTGSSRQNLTLPWTAMSDFAAVDRFAQDVTRTPRVWRNYSTAIGEALAFTLRQFDDAPDCARRVIDVSGDGPSNEGLEPHTLRAALSRAGVTVNGIAIEASEPDLTAYYFENVIAGNGAFVITAARFEDYAREIRRKLLREIVDQTALADP